MFRLGAFFAAIEIAGIMGFILIASNQSTTTFRFAPLIIALLIIGYIVFTNAKNLSKTDIIYVSVIASLIFSSIIELLGRAIYPGLVKDIEFFSRENVVRAGLILLLGFFGHGLLLILAKSWSKIVK